MLHSMHTFATQQSFNIFLDLSYDFHFNCPVKMKEL